MFAYVCPCLHTCMCVCACMCWTVFIGQKSTEGVFLPHSPLYFLSQGLSLNLELCI